MIKFSVAPSQASRGRSLVSTVSADEVYDVLDEAGVTACYPDFRQWFFGKVVLGLGTGERFALVAAVGERIAGVAIGKRTPLERKFCTLWVAPEMRGHNLATQLAHQTFEFLETDKPLFTVSEDRICEFRGLLSSWNFSCDRVYKGLYGSDSKEYVFNGSLKIASH